MTSSPFSDQLPRIRTWVGKRSLSSARVIAVLRRGYFSSSFLSFSLSSFNFNASYFSLPMAPEDDLTK